MIALTVKIDQGKVATTLAQMAGTGPDAAQRRQDAFNGIGQLLVAKAIDNIQARSGPDGPWPRTGLTELSGSKQRWSRIEESMKAVVTEDGVSVGSDQLGAAERQLGTVGAGGELPDIVPVNKKALTIPISEAASRASLRGVDARTAFPTAFVLAPPKGQQSAQNVTMLVRKIGGRMSKKTGQKENQTLEFLYILTQRVAIRPHRFLPIDRQGNLSPASLWTDIEALITDIFLPAAGGTA